MIWHPQDLQLVDPHLYPDRSVALTFWRAAHTQEKVSLSLACPIVDTPDVYLTELQSCLVDPQGFPSSQKGPALKACCLEAQGYREP